jgi:hypothetical protein
MSLKIFYLSKFLPNFPNFQRGTCSSRSHSLDRKWLEIPTVKLGSGNQSNLSVYLLPMSQNGFNNKLVGKKRGVGSWESDLFISHYFLRWRFLTHSIISKLNFINGERSREFQQPEINKNCTGTPTTSTIGNIKPHFKPDYFILIHYIIVMIGTHESISLLLLELMSYVLKQD